MIRWIGLWIVTLAWACDSQDSPLASQDALNVSEPDAKMMAEFAELFYDESGDLIAQWICTDDPILGCGRQHEFSVFHEGKETLKLHASRVFAWKTEPFSRFVLKLAENTMIGDYGIDSRDNLHVDIYGQLLLGEVAFSASNAATDYAPGTLVQRSLQGDLEATGRRLETDEVIDGHRLPAGSLVHLSRHGTEKESLFAARLSETTEILSMPAAASSSIAFNPQKKTLVTITLAKEHRVKGQVYQAGDTLIFHEDGRVTRAEPRDTLCDPGQLTLFESSQ